MTPETLTPVETITSTVPATASPSSAGTVLRAYREAYGLKLDALASTLRVPMAKLQALEEDRLDLLPDAVFARALALAVCRHLNTDAAPVLALLPGHDVSRLAVKDERGLDSPLHRPSLLPQSSFLAILGFFTPMRGAALVVLALAGLLALWPDVPPWIDGGKASTPELTVAPTVPDLVIATPALEPVASAAVSTGHMMITSVQSAAVAPASVTASGVSNDR